MPRKNPKIRTEILDEIVATVQRHPSDGITKASACDELVDKDVGAKDTIWPHFKHLLDEPRGRRRIVLRIAPHGRHEKRLFPAGALEKLEAVKKKLECAKKLLDLLERHPLVGDDYHGLHTVESNRVNCFTPLSSIELKSVGHHIYTIQSLRDLHGGDLPDGYDTPPTDIFRLNARRDLVKGLQAFLKNHILEKYGDTVHLEKRCLTMLGEISLKCTSMRDEIDEDSGSDEDYRILKVRSYGSDKYCKLHNLVNVDIYDAKGKCSGTAEAEFLMMLGRYYFLASMEFAKDFGIDSCREQRTVTAFLKEFFKKEKASAGDNAGQHQHGAGSPLDVCGSFLAEEAGLDQIPEVVVGQESHTMEEDHIDMLNKWYDDYEEDMHRFLDDSGNPKKDAIPASEGYESAMDRRLSFAWFRDHDASYISGILSSCNHDPPGVIEYYLRWLFGTGIFSDTEVLYLSIAFVRHFSHMSHGFMKHHCPCKTFLQWRPRTQLF